jgi:uncharacterized protein YggL (DUF469 family)
MHKRLRKKLKRGEFAELMFLVRWSEVAAKDEAKEWKYIDSLVDFAELIGLHCGGGDRGMSLYAKNFVGSATNEQRFQVSEHLRGSLEIGRITAYGVTELFDGNHAYRNPKYVDVLKTAND